MGKFYTEPIDTSMSNMPNSRPTANATSALILKRIHTLPICTSNHLTYLSAGGTVNLMLLANPSTNTFTACLASDISISDIALWETWVLSALLISVKMA